MRNSLRKLLSTAAPLVVVAGILVAFSGLVRFSSFWQFGKREEIADCSPGAQLPYRQVQSEGQRGPGGGSEGGRSRPSAEPVQCVQSAKRRKSISLFKAAAERRESSLSGPSIGGKVTRQMQGCGMAVKFGLTQGADDGYTY